jgi:hypothetical protein
LHGKQIFLPVEKRRQVGPICSAYIYPVNGKSGLLRLQVHRATGKIMSDPDLGGFKELK